MGRNHIKQEESSASGNKLGAKLEWHDENYEKKPRAKNKIHIGRAVSKSKSNLKVPYMKRSFQNEGDEGSYDSVVLKGEEERETEVFAKLEDDVLSGSRFNNEECDITLPTPFKSSMDGYHEQKNNGKSESKYGRLRSRRQGVSRYHPYNRAHGFGSPRYNRNGDYDSRSSTPTGGDEESENKDQVFQSQSNQDLSQRSISDIPPTSFKSSLFWTQQRYRNAVSTNHDDAGGNIMPTPAVDSRKSALISGPKKSDGLESTKDMFLELICKPCEARLLIDEIPHPKMFPYEPDAQQAYEELRKYQTKCDRLTGAMNYARISMDRANEAGHDAEYAIHRKQLFQLCSELGTCYAQEGFARTCFQDLRR